MRGTRTAGFGTLAAAAVLLAGLLGVGGSASGAGGTAPAAGAAAPAADPTGPVEDDGCDTGRSLPPRKDPGGLKVRQIKARGHLVVGVDQSAYNWGYRDPQTGTIQGFDIDLARAVAQSLFGDPSKIELRTVNTADRITALQHHDVDLIARAMTVTCARMRDVAFSAPYFKVWQQVVAPKSAKVRSVQQAMDGKRVCAADNSSSNTELKARPRGAAKILTPDNQLDCLVLMELGEADSTLSDSSLAYAMVAQDPTMELAGEQFLHTYMGVAMNLDDRDLVAWVNQVLADWTRDGGWQQSYDHWLRPSMGDPGPFRPDPS